MKRSLRESRELPRGEEVVLGAGKSTQAVNITLVVKERLVVDGLDVAAGRRWVEGARVAWAERPSSQLHPLQPLGRAACNN